MTGQVTDRGGPSARDGPSTVTHRGAAAEFPRVGRSGSSLRPLRSLRGPGDRVLIRVQLVTGTPPAAVITGDTGAGDTALSALRETMECHDAKKSLKRSVLLNNDKVKSAPSCFIKR